MLSGDPVAPVGVFNFSLFVSDTSGAAGSAACSIQVGTSARFIGSSAAPVGVLNEQYTFVQSLDSLGPTQAFLSGLNVPSWLSVTVSSNQRSRNTIKSVVMSGLAAGAGQFQFDLVIQDGAGQQSRFPQSIVIANSVVCNATGLQVQNGETLIFQGLACSSVGSVAVEPNGTLIIRGNASVFGDLRVDGSLRIEDGSSLVVNGNFLANDGSIVRVVQAPNNGIPIQITVQAVFGGDLIVVLRFSLFVVVTNGRSALGGRGVQETVQVTPSSVPAGVAVQTVPVAAFSSSTGAFSNVTTLVGYANTCDVYVGTPTAAYGSSTLAVSIGVRRDTSIPGCA